MACCSFSEFDVLFFKGSSSVHAFVYVFYHKMSNAVLLSVYVSKLGVYDTN